MRNWARREREGKKKSQERGSLSGGHVELAGHIHEPDGPKQ